MDSASRYIRRLLPAMLLSAALQAPSQTVDHKTAFTVSDSIAMTTFSDPYGRNSGAVAKESPDHGGFAIVTTRGILSTNQLESSLWYYSRRDLQGFLDREDASAPAPHLLLRKRGKVNILQTNSYGALITGVQWSQDSRSVLALVEHTGARRHLYRIDVRGAAPTDLTPHAIGDIKSPSSNAYAVVFLQAPATTQSQSKNEAPAAMDLTGQALLHILYPTIFPLKQGIGDRWTLQVSRPDGTLRGVDQQKRLFPAAAAATFQPTISPRGDMVITAIPVKTVPSNWAAYKSASTTFRFYPVPDGVDRTGAAYEWPWEYALLDLKTHTVQPLWEAPVGWISGYNNVQMARWSPSGQSILITNVYPPLPNGPIKADSQKPCAVAQYRLLDRQISCVVESQYPEVAKYLRNADFDGDDNHINTQWFYQEQSVHEEFVQKRGAWSMEVSPPRSENDTQIRLSVRQDLTTPPTLWAQEGTVQKRLWDPNPQLSSRFFAKGQVIQWTDPSGYTWKAALLLPPTPKPIGGYPLVIQTHGFNDEHEFIADGSFTTGFAAQPLACAGIAVLQMQDRSDRHQHPAQEEADSAATGFHSAIQHLKDQSLIDASKVGIVGFSRTHWYVEVALEKFPSDFKAAKLIDGIDQSYVTDILFAPDSPLAAREHEGANGAKPYRNGLSDWFQRAAGFNLDKITAAVTLEAIGPISVLGEWEIYSILRQQGKSVELKEIPNGQHILQNPQDRYASQQGTVDWFRLWLQGHERLHAGDDNEYSRWAHMRDQKNPSQGASSPASGSDWRRSHRVHRNTTEY